MYSNKQSQPKPRKVRGTGIFEGDDFSFRPCEEGSPSQLNVRSTKGGKLYETTSESKPLQVAHLSCPLGAADPYAEYVAQLERLGIKPQGEELLPSQQRLVNEDGMQVFLDDSEGVLTYRGRIDLKQSRNWQSDVMRPLQVIVRTLPADKTFTSVINKLKKVVSHV